MGAHVIHGLDHLNYIFTALSSDCPDPVTALEVQTYNDTPSEDPLSYMPAIRELVSNRLLRLVCLVSANYSLLKKSRVTAADNFMDLFRRLMTYLRDRRWWLCWIAIN